MNARMKLSEKARYNLSPFILYQDIHADTPPSKTGQFFVHIRLKDYVMEFIRNPNKTDDDYPEFLNYINEWNRKEDVGRSQVIAYYKSQPTPRLRPGWERRENATDIWYVSPDGQKSWHEAPRRAILTRPSRFTNSIENFNRITA